MSKKKIYLGPKQRQRRLGLFGLWWRQEERREAVAALSGVVVVRE
jgi:hypothetical protein